MSASSSSAVLDRLFARTNAGIKPGTGPVAALLAELGDPQDTFLSVHVAGTNGKGSVSAVLDSVLRAVGLKTGLYTSPHLVAFNERFKIQGHAVSDGFLHELIERVEVADKAAAERERPCTFFELSTAIAFSAFADVQVQVAVIETGLGGRWDATNVIHPLVSVITPVAVDHTEYLGTSLKDIASEKAGIIKEGRPVIVATQDEQVFQLFQNEAREKQAPLIPQHEAVSITPTRQDLDGQSFRMETQNQDYGTCHTPLIGEHQLQNVGVAVLAAEQVLQVLGLDLEADAVKQGLAQVEWPGRCQVISHDPPVLLDGAHNPAGALSLRKTLKSLFPGKKGAFVFGFLNDKDPEGIVAALAGCVGKAYATQSRSPRSVPAEDVGNIVKGCDIVAEVCSLSESMARARTWAVEHDSYVCVTGSLYLVGETLELES